MLRKFIDYYESINTFNFKNVKGSLFFKFGIILLPSALPIGALLLLIAITIEISKNRKVLLKDKYTHLLLIISLLMVIINIYNVTSFNENYYLELPFKTNTNYYTLTIFINLLNWIPLFWAFCGFQFYLNTPEKRILLVKYFIIGSFPVIFSCIAQYWFNWQQSLSILNGLIIWYQKPNNYMYMSGLFNNPNYTAYWITVGLPLTYTLVLEKSKLNPKKIIAILIYISFFYIAIMTNSRNALIGITITFVFAQRIRFKYILIFILSIFSILFLVSNSTTILDNIGSQINYLDPNNLITKISKSDLSNITNTPRIETWYITLKSIFKSPLTGYGSGTFNTIYLLQGGIYFFQHPHNIFLDLSFNYGIPIALIFLSFIVFLFIRLSKENTKFYSVKNKNKFWIIATIISLIFHLTDMPYYDARISILFWLLLSGLKCIGDEKYLEKTENKKLLI